jgi:hypothetical protein
VAALGNVAGLLSMLLLFWVLQRRYLRHSLADDGPMLAQSHLRLDGEGIEATRAHATTRYAWPAFEELTETADLVVVWIDRAPGIVVPKRAFASDEACRGFIGTVLAHLEPADRQARRPALADARSPSHMMGARACELGAWA